MSIQGPNVLFVYVVYVGPAAVPLQRNETTVVTDGVNMVSATSDDVARAVPAIVEYPTEYITAELPIWAVAV